MSIVINCHKSNLNNIGYENLEDWLKDKNNIYIGRFNCFVKGTYNSKWKNPFRVKKYGIRVCLSMYEDYIRNNKQLMDELKELKGKNLGCWCSPGRCHGDILLKLIIEREKEN